MTDGESLEVELDGWDLNLDEDEEVVTLEISGADGEKVSLTMDRESAEELAAELYVLMGLSDDEDDED